MSTFFIFAALLTIWVWVNVAYHQNKQTHELLKGLIETMSQLDDNIAALTAEVTNDTTVIASAVTLINGFAAQLQAAIQAALAAGASPAELQSLMDLKTTLVANDTALAAAVAANTPPIP